MKNIIVLIIILIFQPENYYSQNYNKSIINVDTVTINSSNKIKVISKIDTLLNENSDIHKFSRTIELRQIVSNNLLQTFCDTSDSYDFPNLNFKDINVDENKDIEFISEDWRGNSFSDFWLYDSLSNKFKYSNEFSELGNYNLYSKSKIIETYYNSGWMPSGKFSSSTLTYKIEDNHLIEIKSEGTYLDNEIIYDEAKEGYLEKVINVEFKNLE